ncbi:MAG: methionine--tRNA ligase [Chryseobacterium sp.]|nr:MAG: methionine--tRNA ligase [Chryseobacterium sp.]
MLPEKGRRNITIDGVLWHYLANYHRIIAQNTETNEQIEWGVPHGWSVTPGLVGEVIRSGGKLKASNDLRPKKFITTTLPYANSAPHIGHAFEFIMGDAIARYERNKNGDTNVHFNIGLDEHGKKINDSALAAGKTPQEYLNELHVVWKEFCSLLGVEYNSFYRTSHSQHYKKVEKFWKLCKDKGLIYKMPYYGNYCVGCESFKLDKDLVDGRCPDHHTLEIQQVQEENYFFALTKFKKQLLVWLDGEINLKPESKKEELRHFLEELQDISISRKKESVGWGIPVPEDYTQLVYVWFDALLNYISAAGYFSEESHFDLYWNDSVQIFGPDNLKFQAGIFQGMLCAAGIKNTKTLLCHGMILDKDGRKMSKTVGNVIDPIEQIRKFGVDAVRFYALSGLNVYGNSGWDEVQLVRLHNSHLADNYGNLISRVVHLIDKRDDWDEYHVYDRELFEPQFKEVEELWNNYEISKALHKVNDILTQANQYITEKQPWTKQDSDSLSVLVALYKCLLDATRFYAPVIPGKAQEAMWSLETFKKVILFPKLELEKAQV